MIADAGRVVRVAVDAVADRPERTFSYRLPADLAHAAPGSLVLVTYGRRLALGYLLPGEGEMRTTRSSCARSRGSSPDRC